MALNIINILEKELKVTSEEASVLNKTIRDLKKAERKFYYQKLKPKVPLYKRKLKEYYQSLDDENREEVLNSVVESILINRGEPDLSDKIALKVMDRLEIYKRVRELAQMRDISLRIGSTNGGCVGIIVFVTIILLVISFSFYK
jgi:hypothetical protein